VSSGEPAAPDPSLPVLRTGRIIPVDHPGAIQVTVVGHAIDGDQETIAVRLDPDSLGQRGSVFNEPVVELEGARGQAFVALENFPPSSGALMPGTILWVRRAASESGRPLRATLYGAAHPPSPGGRYHLVVDPSNTPQRATLPREYALALASWLGHQSGAFARFGAERVRKSVEVAPPAARLHGRTGPNLPPPRPAIPSAARWMETLTGVDRIQEALESERSLLTNYTTEPRTVAVTAVKGPRLVPHPWPEMLRQLGRPVPAEPLAQGTPAEFYCLRARTLGALLDALDQVAVWGEPAARVMGGRSEDRRLVERYETELGIRRGPLTRALGAQVIDQVAVVGSDPYWREGTDVTLLFQVKVPAAFQLAMSSALHDRSEGHGELARRTEVRQGVEVEVAKSADGRVRTQRAHIGDVWLVSNSGGALDRVLEALRGKRPRLADEPDVRYLLARDAGERDDLLLLLGERFVNTVVGPSQKIGEARRQVALAELSTAGYASLLLGWLRGRSPTSVDELLRAKLLSKSELAHADGRPIDWQPGRAAHSAWGSPEALVPLIDLPPVDRVSPSERQAYTYFANDYERAWSEYIDPIAVRAAVDRRVGRLALTMRVLPISNDGDMRRLRELSGTANVVSPGVSSGFRAVVGLGRDAMLRRHASDAGHLLGHQFSVDWLGSWVMVGVMDSNRLAVGVRALRRLDVEIPRKEKDLAADGDLDELSRLEDLPLYAAISIRSRAMAAAALLALRQATKDLVSWEPRGEWRGVSIGSVNPSESGHRHRRPSAKGPYLYYALGDKALYVSFNQRTLERLIDDDLDGKGPRSASLDAGKQGTQAVIDLGGSRKGGLFTVLGWVLESALLDRSDESRQAMRLLVGGAPEVATDLAKRSALARALWGAVPQTPDGRDWLVQPDGITDPVWGNPHAPVYAPLPIAGSPATRLLDAVGHLRTSLAFDEEPGAAQGRPERSLRLGLELDLRREDAAK
jgi:hypothetical protein